MDRELKELKRRGALIETFLDAELRERQHLANLDASGNHGPINPWYGASLGLNIHPVDFSPVIAECSLRPAEAVVCDVTKGISVTETDPIQDMVQEPANLGLKSVSLFSGQKHER